jgi:hypothetical protein
MVQQLSCDDIVDKIVAAMEKGYSFEMSVTMGGNGFFRTR